MPHDPTDQREQIVYEGKHVQMVSKGHWEFARRRKASGIVCIVGVTDDNKLILIEQYRPPIGKTVIELPAGLAGDIEGQETEELAQAARRELMEETGYEADTMEYLTEGAASAGITDEVISLFRAKGLRKTGKGEGDGSEQITVHEVPVGEVVEWVEKRRGEGAVVDLKVFGGLYFSKQN